MPILVLIVVSLLLTLAARYEWRWAEPLTSRVARARPWVQSYVRLAPGTFLYLFILGVTTWVLRSSTVNVSQTLLREHSTNLQHLRDDTLTVLVTSAFWLSGRELGLWLVLFPTVLAPAERWLGTLRTIVVFAIGHLTATLVTAAGLSWLIHHHQAPRRLTNVVDVGSSYGFWCVAALFTYRLPGRWRWAWIAALLSGALFMIAWRQDFADYGHLVAMLTGLALLPLSRAHGPYARRAWPIWKPPRPLVEAERERIQVERSLRRLP